LHAIENWRNWKIKKWKNNESGIKFSVTNWWSEQQTTWKRLNYSRLITLIERKAWKISPRDGQHRATFGIYRKFKEGASWANKPVWTVTLATACTNQGTRILASRKAFAQHGCNVIIEFLKENSSTWAGSAAT